MVFKREMIKKCLVLCISVCIGVFTLYLFTDNGTVPSTAIIDDGMLLNKNYIPNTVSTLCMVC